MQRVVWTLDTRVDFDTAEECPVGACTCTSGLLERKHQALRLLRAVAHSPVDGGCSSWDEDGAIGGKCDFEGVGRKNKSLWRSIRNTGGITLKQVEGTTAPETRERIGRRPLRVEPQRGDKRSRWGRLFLRVPYSSIGARSVSCTKLDDALTGGEKCDG